MRLQSRLEHEVEEGPQHTLTCTLCSWRVRPAFELDDIEWPVAGSYCCQVRAGPGKVGEGSPGSEFAALAQARGLVLAPCCNSCWIDRCVRSDAQEEDSRSTTQPRRKRVRVLGQKFFEPNATFVSDESAVLVRVQFRVIVEGGGLAVVGSEARRAITLRRVSVF